MRDYVDARSVWPVYVNGVYAVTLPGKPRDISVEDARVVAGFSVEGFSVKSGVKLLPEV